MKKSSALPLFCVCGDKAKGNTKKTFSVEINLVKDTWRDQCLVRAFNPLPKAEENTYKDENGKEKVKVCFLANRKKLLN